MIKIVQCWDDGIVDDIRLCEILRTHGAKASFNLNPASHKAVRGQPTRYKDCKDVQRLARGELCSVYEGFTIANHTVSHPKPFEVSPETWRSEVFDGRKQLQDIFQQPVYGFAYPYGQHDAATAAVVAEAGHTYGRTCNNITPCYPVETPFRQPTDSHHMAVEFWDRYAQAKAAGAEIFYFWGHSYEFVTEEDWAAYTDKLIRFNADPDAVWADLPEIFPVTG
ncbi:MAG: polysaccharide deacetylase family protein [Kiritimatiellales bacterium]|nr:polysaccharide deacetylase family protein [Kiritimatiellales bacterium]